MSGIVGVVDRFNNMRDRQKMLENMAESIKHRGPDGINYWIEGGTGLANCNLLVNCKKAVQPFEKNFGPQKLVLTFNGEIFNFRELRIELENLGHEFTTESDTEVILDAYIEWGIDCLNKFDGMFAFGLWDEIKQELILARDQLGAKPLYYFVDDSKIIFASEIKAILKHENVEAMMDKNGLCELFAVGPATTPGLTPFTDILELKSGNFLYFNREETRIAPYFTLEAEEHHDDLDTTVEKVRCMVKGSVESYMRVDLPHCVLISGGLDSSSIVAFMHQNYKRTGQQLKTVSLEYENHEQFFIKSDYQPTDDKPFINKIVKHFDTQHEVIKISPNNLSDTLKESMIARDIPGMADVDSSLYYLFSQIKDKFPVIFSGECGDEVFGGYPWYCNNTVLEDKFPWMHSETELQRVLNTETTQTVSMDDYIKSRFTEAMKEVPVLPGESDIEKAKRQIMYMNLTRFMALLAHRKDRMSMANGVEARMPFCNVEMTKYLFNVPFDIKLVDGQEKGLLKRALKGLLPEDIIQRKKSPFPKTHDPKYEVLVKRMLIEILQDSTSPILNFVNKSEILKMMQENSDYSNPFIGQLMSRPQLYAYLIQVDNWFREYQVAIK